MWFFVSPPPPRDFIPPKSPGIIGLKLIIQENYAITADNKFFIALGIPNKYLYKINRKNTLDFSGSYETSLNTSPLPKVLSLHCKQINRVKNEVDGQPSSLLPCMQFSDYKAAFAPMHLVFLELDTHNCYLDFKLDDENNNAIIARPFYIQLLNKDYEHIR